MNEKDLIIKALVEMIERDGGSVTSRTIDRVVAKASPQKKARKVSAYSKRYGREYKRLKAKHPRASFGSLSKKAHAATKKGLKK